MKTDIQPILRQVTRWAAGRDDVAAVALVGSWARDAAKPDSDIDLILLTPAPAAFRPPAWLAEIEWPSRPVRWQDEEYGIVWSRRIWLADGMEIEFGFGPLSWAQTNPLDAGTEQVIRDGCRILFDPQGILTRLVAFISQGG